MKQRDKSLNAYLIIGAFMLSYALLANSRFLFVVYICMSILAGFLLRYFFQGMWLPLGFVLIYVIWVVITYCGLLGVAKREGRM